MLAKKSKSTGEKNYANDLNRESENRAPQQSRIYELGERIRLGDNEIVVDRGGIYLSKQLSISVSFSNLNTNKPTLIGSQAGCIRAIDNLGNEYRLTSWLIPRNQTHRLIHGSGVSDSFGFESIVPGASEVILSFDGSKWGGDGTIRVRVPKSVLLEAAGVESILVLVANRELQKGIAITSADVRVRELAPSERQLYEQIRDRVMPPMVSAAQLKIPLQKIKADDILKRTDFQEELPEAVSLPLEEGMRSVNVSVPKDRCSGGVIQKGEHVDVLLTSRISNDPKYPNAETKTAMLARDCRVIMKRKSMVPIRATILDVEGPIIHTLEVNPYRAALIEYAQHKGLISLIPRHDDKTLPVDKEEQERIDATKKDGFKITDADVMQIFGITIPMAIPAIIIETIIGR